MSIEKDIKREAKLAAIELELERRFPGFTGPVKLKQNLTGIYQCTKCGASGQSPVMRHYGFCPDKGTGNV